MSSAFSTDIRLGDAWRTLTHLLSRLREVSHREDWLVECLDALVQELDADRCLVLTHAGGADFVVEARSPDGTLDATQRQRISHSLLRRAREERRRVLWEIGDDMHASESLASFGIVAAAAIPLVSVGETAVLGALYIDFRRPRWTLDETAIDLLESIADTISVSLDRQAAVQSARADLIDARSDEAGLTLDELLAPISMRAVSDALKALGPRTSVLVVGEPGSGKSTLATAIATRSDRRPIVRALPMTVHERDALASELFGRTQDAVDGEGERLGLVAQASGGSLIVESIETYPEALREQLAETARFGRYRPIGWRNEALRSDVRCLATYASSVPLALDQDRWLQPFADILVMLPPLRQRKTDIVPLVQGTLARFDPGTSWRISEDARQWLTDPVKGWPGNLRQLVSLVRHAMRRALADNAHANTIKAAHLDAAPGTPDFLSASYEQLRARKTELEDDERRFLAARMQAHDYNLSRVAREVGLARTSLISRLESLGIERPAGRPGRPR